MDRINKKGLGVKQNEIRDPSVKQNGIRDPSVKQNGIRDPQKAKLIVCASRIFSSFYEGGIQVYYRNVHM